ncbi:MAG: MarR family transcriptional regulator [Pseudomonadota bacterium]
MIAPRLTRLVWRIYNFGYEETRPFHKIALREWRVLATLGRFGRLSVGEISRITGGGHTVVSKAAKSLRSKGYVEATQSAADKRQTLVELTPDGLAAHDEIAPVRTKLLTEVEMGLTAAERKTLLRLCSKLERWLDAASEEDGDGWA